MIEITCTGCRAVLQIDDAFAGAVCRCQQCGTIQTVPPRQKAPGSGKPPTAQLVSQPSKTLYAGAGSGTGLDDLAQAVASSGLAGSGLRSARLQQAHSAARSNRWVIWTIAGAVGFVLLGSAITWLIMRQMQVPTAPTSGGDVRSPDGVPQSPSQVLIQPNGPAFINVPLRGPSVVYLLDRGQGTIDTFDAIKGATMKSISSLGGQIKFQVIFWETDKLVAFPPAAPTYATADNVASCRSALGPVYAYQQSRIGPALEKALSQNPAEIVLVSGKAELDDEFVKTVLSQCSGKPLKVHAFSMGGFGSPKALKEIADKTGGQFREVTGEALQDCLQYTPG